MTLLKLKLAPPETALLVDGLPADAGPDARGWRSIRLVPGAHELILVAEGYIALRRSVILGAEPLLVECKLERAGSPLAFEATGATGGRPKSVAFTPDGARLVVPLLAGPGADVLDARSLELLGRLRPPPGYAGIEGFVECLFLTALREIWVSQMHTSTIHVFDLDGLAYKTSFPSGGEYPKVLAASIDGSRVFASDWVSEDLSVFDARSRTLKARIPLGGTPRGLAASPDGRYLYIARFVGGSILRLRLDDMFLDTLYPGDGGAKRHLVLDASGARLFATDLDRGSLFVIGTAKGDLIKEIGLGPNPNTCAISPDGRTIFACTRGPDGIDGYEYPGPLAGEIIAVDAESLEILARQWGGDQPTGLALSPDGKRLVFTDFLDDRVEAYRLDGPLAGRLPSATRAK
jgi:YVTN family beta-propeller protein